MSYATERAFAEANGTDIRDPRAPHIPVCKAEADWIADELIKDATERLHRIAARLVDDKADMRARCTVNWSREFQYAARPILALQQQLSANGFDARQIDPVLIALRDALIQINQENDRGSN